MVAVSLAKAGQMPSTIRPWKRIALRVVVAPMVLACLSHGNIAANKAGALPASAVVRSDRASAYDITEAEVWDMVRQAVDKGARVITSERCRRLVRESAYRGKGSN